MTRRLLVICIASIAMYLVALGTVAATASLLLQGYRAATQPHTHQASVAQLLERQRISYRMLALVPVCPSDSETCLGWHVNLSTGAPPPTYGWLTCPQTGNSCSFSLPAHGLHSRAMPAPVAEPPWLRTIRRQVRVAKQHWETLSKAWPD